MLTEQIMKSSPFSRIIVSVSMVILLAFAAYNWAVSPQTTYLNASQKYTEMNDTVQKKVLVIKKSVAVKKKQLKATREKIDGLKSNFFTPSQSSEFFSGIEMLAENSGCNIELMTFKGNHRREPGDSKTDNVRFYRRCASVRFIGGYGQIIEFLKNITDCPENLSLSDLSISSLEGVQGLVCNIDITVYISEDKELIPDENG